VTVPPHIGWFEKDADVTGLPVELLVIERLLGKGPAWHAVGALVREPDSAPEWLPGWVDDYWSQGTPAGLWEYFCDKGGGNGYSWDVAFVRVASVEDAEAVTAHLDATLRATGHPLGFFASMATPATSAVVQPPAVEEPVDEPGPVVEPPAPEVVEPPYMELPFHLSDALTWRLASELVRRHPDTLWLVRTFPMDGNYDCLTVRRLSDPTAGPSILMNRHGNNCSIDRFDRHEPAFEQLKWTKAVWEADPRDWLREIEDLAGLAPPVGGLPASTPSSIAIRWVAAFLGAHLASRTRWDTFLLWDLPQHDAPVGKEIRAWAATGQDVPGRVWVLRSGDDALAVTADGRLLRPGQDPVDLLAAYRAQGRSVTRLLGVTAGDLLP
jgi:hypothetical protein